MNPLHSEKLTFLKQEKIRSLLFVYGFLAVLLPLAQIISPGFMSLSHMDNVLRQAAFLGIVAIGQTFVILTGGIDLSVASIITFSNIVSAQIMFGQDGNVPRAFAAILAIGLAIGLLNGAGILFFRISPMIMTLAMSGVIRGIALIYSKGAPKGETAPFIQFLSTGKIGVVISVLIIFWVVLSVITIFVLRKTIFGRSIYIMGTNALAARYSGINIPLMTMAVYIAAALMSSLTGMLIVGYTKSSYISAGDPYTMNSIAAVVIGGTSIIGGIGGYAGTIAGSIIMVVIVSLLTIVRIPESGRLIVQGVLIILLVLLYSRQKSK
jgi:ribose transport system permease protein